MQKMFNRKVDFAKLHQFTFTKLAGKPRNLACLCKRLHSLQHFENFLAGGRTVFEDYLLPVNVVERRTKNLESGGQECQMEKQ